MQVQKVEPFVVHTTFQYGGPAGKLSRLRERNLWQDRDDYFAGSFVSGDIAAPAAPADWDAMDTDARIAFHRRSIAAQLAQLRQLFVLAVAMNRTLVVPRLTCFCDRYWGPVEQ